MNKLQLTQSTLITKLIELANNDAGVSSYLLENHNLKDLTVKNLINCNLSKLIEDCVCFRVTAELADDYEQIIFIRDLIDNQEVDITEHYYDCCDRLIEDEEEIEYEN